MSYFQCNWRHLPLRTTVRPGRVLCTLAHAQRRRLARTVDGDRDGAREHPGGAAKAALRLIPGRDTSQAQRHHHQRAGQSN